MNLSYKLYVNFALSKIEELNKYCDRASSCLEEKAEQLRTGKHGLSSRIQEKI
ncbi:hypothetical protein [Coleofasciculus sp. FACHB-1120]|uniref:hypothetical protein n=1 Tax=Coleofasciculus sp. FACHB-1120 TaxID=2692783 RepID=UPI00168427BC|nr:hypothetical protein [Coleofasciculus sp. FACHB-1120]MBD2742129.1 hypothetical protein [Coleofasciculus sp. FACHB-1120]